MGLFTALIYYFIMLKLFDCLGFCLRGSLVQIAKTILEAFFPFQHIFAEHLHYHNMFNEPNILLVQSRGKFEGVEKLRHRYNFLTNSVKSCQQGVVQHPQRPPSRALAFRLSVVVLLHMFSFLR